MLEPLPLKLLILVFITYPKAYNEKNVGVLNEDAEKGDTF